MITIEYKTISKVYEKQLMIMFDVSQNTKILLIDLKWKQTSKGKTLLKFFLWDLKLPGHSSALEHVCSSVASPTQLLPSQRRRLVWLPKPHVWEHEFQEDQLVQRPFKMKKKIQIRITNKNNALRRNKQFCFSVIDQ